MANEELHGGAGGEFPPPGGRPWRVVCAGPMRSGSAWLYNTVRLALADRGPVYACPDHLYDPEDPRPFHVVKVHAFNARLCTQSERILTTRRDLRDVAASALRVGLVKGEFGVVGLVAQVVAAHRAWGEHSAEEIVFEHMMRDKVGATRRVMEALFAGQGAEAGEVDCAALSCAVEALEAPVTTGADTAFDPLTLMVPGHITGGGVGTYAQTLPPRWVRVIEDMHGDWLAEHGYDGRANGG